jgi:hypothetical protein
MKRYLSIVTVAFVLAALCSVSSAAPRAGAILRMNLPEMRFTNIPLSEAIDFVRDVSGANLQVNWRALETVGVTKDMPVNMRLRAVTLRKVLRVLMAETGAEDQLAITIDDNVIELTTREIADSRMYTRVYNIEDLIMVIPDFEGPRLDLQSNSSSRGQGGGSSGRSVFDQDSNEDRNENRLSRRERAQQIIDLIVDVVRPEIWRQNGGNASIAFLNGNLIITAPRSVHEAIGGPFD